MTRIAPKTDRSKGWVKGKPLRFALGHNARVTNLPRRTGVGLDDWTVEDRGYSTPCWLWKHGKPINKSSNYRRVGIDGHYESVHVAVYRSLVGEIPEGRELHHLCGLHECVNPAHLKPLTKSEHLSLHKRRLSDEQVMAIRKDRRPLREIAADYGINYRYACCVRTGWYRGDAQ
jgi:hypothetical protein